MIDKTSGKTVPGTVQVIGRGYLYVSEERFDCPTHWFTSLTKFTPEQRPQAGGVLAPNCRLKLPDGSTFSALSYKGDLVGWRSIIVGNAEHLGLKCATLDGELLKIENGAVWPLAECQIEFYEI